jgi:acetylglutamate kinase
VKVVVKVGGTLLDQPESRHTIARQLAEIAKNNEIVVVHGGGKQVTRFLEERGVPTRFVDGLRVSDANVIDAATKVIAGTVNKELVSALIGAGALPVGLSGIDGLLTRAVPLHPELAFVGHPSETDRDLLHLFLSSGYVPVIACIAADEHGNIYNVNADQMAVSCAVSWRSDVLILLTDVEGVKDQGGNVITSLTAGDIQNLIESGVATAGMLAKLKAAEHALRAGLEEIVIASGHLPGICQRILSGEAIGTRLSCEPVLAKGLAG